MQKISAMNQNNQPLEIEVIRYFKVDDKKYLIFTLQEKDEQDYIKVYVSKILGLNGTLAAYDIIDETEWASVRELVKKIIKINREGGTLEIEDLSLERLTNIKINGQQAFKLIGNLIDLLGSNINAKKDEEDLLPPPVVEEATVEKEEPESVENPPASEPAHVTTESQSVDSNLLERYQQLVEENARLKTIISNIKAIIGE